MSKTAVRTGESSRPDGPRTTYKSAVYPAVRILDPALRPADANTETGVTN